MDPTTLHTALFTFLPPDEIRRLSIVFGVELRARKRDITALVTALVLVGGSDDSGRQADVYSAYLREAELGVVRGTVYAWLHGGLAWLMTALLPRALDEVGAGPVFLPKGLGGVGD